MTSKNLYQSEMFNLLKSLGFPSLKVHHARSHFDFTKPSRRILVVGPMGSGKTEYSAMVWRDSQVVLKKSTELASATSYHGVDRRKVFFVRSKLDAGRFPDYPDDALAYRGGFEHCGKNIAMIKDSFELENLLAVNPQVGTWIIDEASFYDERLAYIVRQQSKSKGKVFIFPTLVLNFRREIFNPTARLLLDTATDVFPLTAYCEHKDCLTDSFYTYRYYKIDNKECPSLFFDPLIIIGGDREKDNPTEPNYCTRCDLHHYLPGKEYTFLILKPLGEKASAGDLSELKVELSNIRNDMKRSMLYSHLKQKYQRHNSAETYMNSLKVPYIAEKAAIYLFNEQNLISIDHLKELAHDLDLNTDYLTTTLTANKRPVSFE